MTSAVVLELPPDAKAPGIRVGIRKRADWRLNEVIEGWGLVEPAEGAGVGYPYFKVTKLCDANTTLTPATWQPLIENPAASKDDITPSTKPGGEPDPQWAEKLAAFGKRAADSGRPGGDLLGISSTLGALPPEDVPAYLQQQMPYLFKENPDASLWFFGVDPLFTRRTALFRVLLALKTIPDYVDAAKPGDELPKIRTLQEHTLTSGSDCTALAHALLLAIPPTAMGYAFPWMPHSLVFLFGHPTSILAPQPPSFASLYMPRLQSSSAGFHWQESDFFEGVGVAEVETLLQWWVTRLNVIYSYALDPTNFDDGNGLLDVKAQAVWYLTFERLLADALLIASSPQSAALARLETGFDLLDKAESLLGYRKKKSGKGFTRLLRKDEMVPRLEAIWNTRLPLQLRSRFSQHTKHLYERLYAGIQSEAYEFRLTSTGINVWSSTKGALGEWSWDDYVPALVRAVRNSAHGLIEVFDKPAEKDIVATHSGEMPVELPELAAFIAFSMVADAERLCDGTWFD